MKTFLAAFACVTSFVAVVAFAFFGLWLVVGLLSVVAIGSGWVWTAMAVEATAEPPASTYRESERNYW